MKRRNRQRKQKRDNIGSMAPRRSPRRWTPRVQWMLAAIAVGAILIWVRPREPFVPPVNGAPKLVVDPAAFDFGDVPVGRWVRAAFEVQNVGSEPLRFMERPWVELVEGC